MNNTDFFELKVCKICDAPLPYKPIEVSCFNINKTICDDCLSIKKNSDVD